MTRLTSDAAFQTALRTCADDVAQFLSERLTALPRPEEAGRPEPLVAAMRHGVLNGGKRFRPFLVTQCARLGEQQPDPQSVLFVAAALEAVHCYSLIHDDLPAMDDDDLRRGKPTVHIAFDEATAILAGDGLLTEAFALVSDPSNRIAAETRCEIVRVLARDAGLGGMVGGQSFDLANEHRSISEDDIVMTQALKTGALVRASCETGGLLAGLTNDLLDHVRRYGEIVGLTFQIADDLLDLTSNTETLGKAAGKDEQAGKRTLVSLHGERWARKRLDGLIQEAGAVLDVFGEKASLLRAATHFVAYRSS